MSKFASSCIFVCLTARVSRPTTACLFPHSLSTVGRWTGTTFDQTPQLIFPFCVLELFHWARRSLKVFEGSVKVFKRAADILCKWGLEELFQENREKKDRECPLVLWARSCKMVVRLQQYVSGWPDGQSRVRNISRVKLRVWSGHRNLNLVRK